MASTVQLEEGNGLLPPLRELLLESQVNKLINEYLFSSNADVRYSSLHDGSSESKENQVCFLQTAGQRRAEDPFLRSACNAPCLNPANVMDDHHLLCLQDSQSLRTSTGTENQLQVQSQESLILHSRSRSEDETIQSGQQASFHTLSVEKESRKVQKSTALSRVDTFPCTSKGLLPAVAPCKMDTEVKASCNKPPRPPSRLQKSELGHPLLARCSSDNGASLQSFRRARAERKRKAAASASGSASTWALLFTFCFAIIMIAQGFWSQSKQNSENSASSPVETFMKGSIEKSAEDISGVGAEDRQAGADDVAAQPYRMRKVLLRHGTDMKHSKPKEFPNR